MGRCFASILVAGLAGWYMALLELLHLPGSSLSSGWIWLTRGAVSVGSFVLLLRSTPAIQAYIQKHSLSDRFVWSAVAALLLPAILSWLPVG